MCSTDDKDENGRKGQELCANTKKYFTVAGVLIVILAINTPYLYRLKISVENEAAARVEKAKAKAREDSIAVVKAKAVADSIEIANKKRVALEDSLRHKRLAKEPNPFYFDFEERFGIIEPFARDEKTLRKKSRISRTCLIIVACGIALEIRVDRIGWLWH